MNTEGYSCLKSILTGCLINSMAHFGFETGFTKDNLMSMVMDYIKKYDLKNVILRLTVTYGNKNKGIEPAVFFQRGKTRIKKLFMKKALNLWYPGL